MPDYSVDAYYFKLGFMLGLIERDEIIAWADQQLMENEYVDAVANISLSSHCGTGEFLILLDALMEDPLNHRKYREEAIRRLVPRIIERLEVDLMFGRDCGDHLSSTAEGDDYWWWLSLADDYEYCSLGMMSPEEAAANFAKTLCSRYPTPPSH